MRPAPPDAVLALVERCQVDDYKHGTDTSEPGRWLVSTPLSIRLTGTWELLSREDVTQSGERRIDNALGADPFGVLIYDGNGHFSAQFMKRVRDGADAGLARNAAPNNSRARDGYDAYFGSYTVDDTQGSVTQTLVGALSRENVGQVLTRSMQVDGDELVIRLDTATDDGEAIVRTLRWRRIG